jgi:hypothetical protein
MSDIPSIRLAMPDPDAKRIRVFSFQATMNPRSPEACAMHPK